MKNRVYFFIYLICLFLIALLNIDIGFSNEGNIEYLVIGLILLIMSIGLIFKNDFLRKVLLLLSKTFIFLIYIPIWLMLLCGQLKGFSGIAVLSLAPVFIISLMTISCLTKADIVQQFKENGA